ncbi:MAG TPA: hypothetical protein VGG85_15420 [Terracidiphilus sp.]
MKIPHGLACAVIAAPLSTCLSAQQTQTGYHTAACIKIKPDKTAEFHKWAEEEMHSTLRPAWILVPW